MAKTILVIIDPLAREQPVVQRAAWLAELAGASLELFACAYDANIDAGHIGGVTLEDTGARERILEDYRRKVEALAAPLAARGLKVTVDVRWDYPLGEAVVEKSLGSTPWLICKAAEHHNILQRTLLSNTDWYLIRHCSHPLWLTKPARAEHGKTVLAAIDPLHEHDKPASLDAAILAFATDLAQATRGELHVVHAFAAPMGVELPPDVGKLVAGEHKAALAAFLARHPVPAERVHLIQGFAHEALQRAVREHRADFVVMGAVSRSGLKKLFVGSTAERVLDRLECDLIIIKPAGFAAPGE